MTMQAVSTSPFIRKTALGGNEYHKNFYKLDLEIISTITSAEADKVTPLMSKIYLRLVNAPAKFWERDRVLRFEADYKDGKQLTAWEALCDLTGVASATARKALLWLHQSGVIGYFAGKNGVGIRIWLNRATASVGINRNERGQKNLHATDTSNEKFDTSPNEAGFNDSFADQETLDSDKNPAAPKNGAGRTSFAKFSPPKINPLQLTRESVIERTKVVTQPPSERYLPIDKIIAQIKAEIGPGLTSAAAHAATQVARNEIERTRQWFETKALPKAVRVAQSETYNLLRKLDGKDEREARLRADLQVGRAVQANHSCSPSLSQPQRLTPAQIIEAAQVCRTLIEVQGQTLDQALATLSSERGGWVLPEDMSVVRQAALGLLDEVGK